RALELPGRPLPPSLSPSEGERVSKELVRGSPDDFWITKERSFMGSEHLQNSDVNRSHEPVGIPLNRPPGTFSPTGREGRDEGVRFMGRVAEPGEGFIPIKNGKSAFVQLLEAVNDIEGLERIRFTSPHPRG